MITPKNVTVGETQFSGFIAPNLKSENPQPLDVAECSYVVRNPGALPVAVLAASLSEPVACSLISRKQSCVILATQLLVV